MQWVWLRATLGLSSQPTAEALGWQASSVRHGPARYFEKGEEVLRDQPHVGRYRARFTREVEQELLAPFLARAEQGEFVIIAPVPQAYAQRLGPPVHHSIIYRALCIAKAGAKSSLAPSTRKRIEPCRRNLKRFPERVQEEIKPSPATEGRPVRLMFADEARFGRLSRLAAGLRQAYGPRCQPRSCASTSMPMRR